MPFTPFFVRFAYLQPLGNPRARHDLACRRRAFSPRTGASKAGSERLVGRSEGKDSMGTY